MAVNKNMTNRSGCGLFNSNMFNRLLNKFLVIVCLCLMPFTYAFAADVQVYKGKLSVLIHEQESKNRLLLQYRTKTKEVLRIAVRRLRVIDVATKQSIRLDDRDVNLSDVIDDGYWITDIAYDDLDLTGDDYRIEGILVFYLAGSQQSRNISVYLKSDESDKNSDGNSIDWGISEPG